MTSLSGGLTAGLVVQQELETVGTLAGSQLVIGLAGGEHQILLAEHGKNTDWYGA